jgi:hypothetical protein
MDGHFLPSDNVKNTNSTWSQNRYFKGSTYSSISFSASCKMKNDYGPRRESDVSVFSTTLQNQFLTFYPAKNSIWWRYRKRCLEYQPIRCTSFSTS